MVALIFSALSVLSQLPLPNTILPFLQAALKPFRPFPLHSCTFCKNISRFNPSFKSPRRINIRDSSSFLFLSFFLFHSRFFRSFPFTILSFDLEDTFFSFSWAEIRGRVRTVLDGNGKYERYFRLLPGAPKPSNFCLPLELVSDC